MATDKTEKGKANKRPSKAAKFFKEVRSELKKVIWPTKRQLRKNTVVVLLCLVIVGVFISLLDAGFGLTLGKVVEKYGQQSQADGLIEDGSFQLEDYLNEQGELPADEGQAPVEQPAEGQEDGE